MEWTVETVLPREVQRLASAIDTTLKDYDNQIQAIQYENVRLQAEIQAKDQQIAAKDQMANLGCVSVCTSGNFFAPILVTTHRVNNLDLSHEQGFENESYESD